MKIKSIKLREAHKNSGVASFCSIHSFASCGLSLIKENGENIERGP